MQIKLLTLDSSEYTLEQQLRKFSEEHHEVIFSLTKGNNLLHLTEELIDLMQSCKTALEILNTNKVVNVELANIKHIAKLKQRASEGKIKLLEDEEYGKV